MTNEELIKKAKEAMKYSYAPYSNFNVGAALLLSDGSVYTGCNIENSSYSVTICAERTALFKAVSEGRRDFEKIAIVSSSGDKTYPCGMCIQALCEFMAEKSVVLEDNKGNISEIKIKNLMPYCFKL
jgi:cytidine deaminase